MASNTFCYCSLDKNTYCLSNDALAKVAQRNLEEVGGFRYTPEEEHFAEQLQKSLPPGGAGKLDSTAIIQPLRRPDPNAPAASTDVGDVSWNVPTIVFGTASVCARSGSTYLAGGGLCRDEYWTERDGDRGEGASCNRRGFVYEPAASGGCEVGFRTGEGGKDVSVGDTGGPEAALGLPDEVIHCSLTAAPWICGGWDLATMRDEGNGVA